MNRFFVLATSVCLSIALLCGCKKNDSNPGSSSSMYTMSATIAKPGDTTLFAATGSNWVTASEMGQECQILASDTLGGVTVSKFTFLLFNFIGIGTYTFDSSSFSNSDYAVYETTGPAYTQTIFASCSVNITKVSGNNVYGTFGGTLTDGSVIKNGSFVALGSGF